MGLFDKIKKTLFGNNEEKAKQAPSKPEEEKAEVAEETNEVKPEENKSAKIETNVESAEDKNESPASDEVKNEPEVSSTKEEQTDSEEVVDSKPEKDTVASQEVEDSSSEEEKGEEIEPEAESSESKTQELYDNGLKKTNQGFGARLNAFFAQFRSVDEDFFDELEDLLIESDVGFETSEELVEQLKDEAKLQNAKSHDELKKLIVQKLVDIYDQNGDSEAEKLTYNDGKTNVYLFVGVNGAGKTTTIGKLAQRFKNQGKKVVLVAADTFRAGAVEQLKEWGKRTETEVVTGPVQADPASVVYDGVKHGLEEKADYVLVDTAGRLQNKQNLMKELEKIERTIKKLLPEEPSETLLVLDGSTGQNALLQAKDFDKTTKLTGLVLTKLDGSSKGGVILAIRNEMKLPVKLVGLGEKAEDLADFDAASYAVGLFHGIV
ncbi:signal recognition particle-docking protein FtsY [Lactobacillus mulieris]|uniref:signal recognition particle-docking protein FtsY n=1 Tax=Lactobacillus mulieris TaxID=2508708 RepID=UPI001432975A|nr:signal recognition particle-docking protein FtsY [Lactobacillus mulieris]MCF1782995.1 signal recognition particle-docking protein FtsY [Lactobacillus mulieris]MCW8103748.1 signal recognition particle-docking protein FtsY [Lactobacillus mulieris]MDK6802717.1 signal recognition particle-docking protein FtsY [Lactobacillus mulieris]MDK8381833.1 signal recognition particle-docking protein FtsY [Lactobacillus mulieris]MDT9620043.1 signal recognition particle-docking protein FtsY [Lactobacillus m